jgi:phosphoadenosine phosphosulfate reductase
MSNTNSIIKELAEQFSVNAVENNLADIGNRFAGEAVFSSSFSYEDQVITDFIEIFTLDTGRLFPETYSTWSATLEKYRQPVIAYYPNAVLLQNFVAANGPNSFYESVDNRKQCCHIRKVEPLQRALKGKKIWITGIRAEHSPGRNDMPLVEWDEVNKVIKYHPLLHWTTEEVTNHIHKNNIPYNPLHTKGFISIGCAPCTRATKPGEDFRAGRWWWEHADKKECGLHIHEPAKN